MASHREVAKFRSLAEANVVVGFLQANGVDASLANAHTHAVLPVTLPFQSYRVTAPQTQVLDARRLLASVENIADEDDQGAGR